MSAWPLPIMYTAWGTGPGYEWDGWKIEHLRTLATEAGFKTVACQLGYVAAEQLHTLKATGLKTPVWNVVGPSSSKAMYDELGSSVDGLIVQVEGEYQRQGAVAALDEGIAQGQPKACVTTYSGLEQGQWSELASRGVMDCQVECYRSDAAVHADLDRMLSQGVVYGIPSSTLYAICGTYTGDTPIMYSGLDKLGRNYGCYLGEPMTQAQWTAWGGVNKVTAVYWWVLSAGTSILHEERAATWTKSDGSTTNGLTEMTKWQLGHLDAIRAANSVRLERVLK